MESFLYIGQIVFRYTCICMAHALCKQVLCKPKILPLKSVTLEKLEQMQKEVCKCILILIQFHVLCSVSCVEEERRNGIVCSLLPVTQAQEMLKLQEAEGNKDTTDSTDH